MANQIRRTFNRLLESKLLINGLRHNKMKIAHIINPFKAKKTQDLFLAQPVTFKTMETAQAFAGDFGVEVELYAAYYPEDEVVVPDSFIKTPSLERSVIDVAQAQFQVPKKFPLIRDILDRLYHATDADYLVYTNVDIALMPHFYSTVAGFILQKGVDGLSINRRTISRNYRGVEDIPFMYAEYGENHPGSDCFVFRRDSYPQYQLFDACIGAGGIGALMVLNVACNARKFQIIGRKHHLTFHIGNDRRTPKDHDPLVNKSSERRDDLYGDRGYPFHNSRQISQSIEYYMSANKVSNHHFVKKMVSNYKQKSTLPPT